MLGALPMKGPHERLKYDLRRLWECPACKRRERTPGSITFRHCTCRLKQLDGKPVVMLLLEDHIQRLTPAVNIQHPADEPAPPQPASQETVTNTAAESPGLVPPVDQ